jgi:hypothetical protein
MMSGGDINLIKTRRSGPESVEHAEGFLDEFDKNFMDRETGDLAPAKAVNSQSYPTVCGY